MRPFNPKSWPIFDFFFNFALWFERSLSAVNQKGVFYVKKSKESIKIILLRRKNHYEPVLPQISTNIWFFFNIALLFERRLSAVNQNEAILCKKVQGID